MAEISAFARFSKSITRGRTNLRGMSSTSSKPKSFTTPGRYRALTRLRIRRPSNRTVGEAYRAGLAIETIHLRDISRMRGLDRFKIIVFANTWLMTAAQRRFIREKVIESGRHYVVFQGTPGYCDGRTLSHDFTRELLEPARRNVRHFADPPITAAHLREVAADAGTHLYTDAEGDIIHAAGGLILIRSKDGATRTMRLKTGKQLELTLLPGSSWIFDSATGERLLT